MGFPLMITEFLKFLGVRLLSLAVENFLLYVAAEWLCIHIYIGKAGVGIFMILAVFFINKYFVFTRK